MPQKTVPRAEKERRKLEAQKEKQQSRDVEKSKRDEKLRKAREEPMLEAGSCCETALALERDTSQEQIPAIWSDFSPDEDDSDNLIIIKLESSCNIVFFGQKLMLTKIQKELGVGFAVEDAPPDTFQKIPPGRLVELVYCRFTQSSVNSQSFKLSCFAEHPGEIISEVYIYDKFSALADVGGLMNKLTDYLTTLGNARGATLGIEDIDEPSSREMIRRMHSVLENERKQKDLETHLRKRDSESKVKQDKALRAQARKLHGHVSGDDLEEFANRDLAILTGETRTRHSLKKG